MRISKMRGIVAFVLVIALTVIGLLFDTGLGTACSAGIGVIASICPLGALETLLGAKSASVRWVICAGVAVVLVVVFGKAFCAWGCPVPWLQRFFSRKGSDAADKRAGQLEPDCTQQDVTGGAGAEPLGPGASLSGPGAVDTEKLDADIAANIGGHKVCALHALGGKRDGLQVDSRHVVLLGALASAGIFGFPVFCLICPVGLSFATLIGLWNLLAFNETSWGMIVFPAVLVIEVAFLRKWCFKICPISALTSLISTLNISLRPAVDKKRCLREQGIDCHACVDACPEQLDPHSAKIPECSKCHICTEACPAKAISFPLLRKRAR